jgi:quercetin dioxygenase-like cupin family protein
MTGAAALDQETLDNLAAEYVLGVLDGHDQGTVDRLLGGDTGFRQRVAAWEARLMPLAETLPELAPPAGLWERIEAEIGKESFVTVHAEEGDWQTIGLGVTIKHLYVDKAAGVRTFLLRLAPGVSLDRHPHPEDEECFVLEGEARVAGIRLRVGDYHRAPKGVMHDVFYTERGVVFFVRGAIDEHVA